MSALVVACCLLHGSPVACVYDVVSSIRRHLREALKMANAEDLNRLTSCALVLLGHLFYVTGAPREAANMASPAMQLASKIPDLQLQLWAADILKSELGYLGVERGGVG